MSSRNLHFDVPGISTGRSGNMDTEKDTAGAGSGPEERTAVDHRGIGKDTEKVLEAFFNWSVCHH